MPLCIIHINVPTQLILIQASVPGSRLEITVKLTTFNDNRANRTAWSNMSLMTDSSCGGEGV